MKSFKATIHIATEEDVTSKTIKDVIEFALDNSVDIPYGDVKSVVVEETETDHDILS